MIQALDLKKRYGSFWLKERSAYFMVDESIPIKDYENVKLFPSQFQTRRFKLNTFNIKGIILRFIISLADSLVRIAVLWTESLVNMNFSLLANIMSVGPFLVAVSFYYIFSEKLHKIYIVGIVLMIGCAILTGWSSTTTTDSDS